MFFRRFYDDKLAQASYLVGCQATGEAIIVDPNRDIDQYLAAAAAEQFRITAVTETHIHADYVSGSRELARRASATLYLSAEGGADWQYAFAADSGATLLHDGDVITLGRLRLQVMHTPGHTPEHLAFVLTDTPASDQPMGAFTGDFVFVGDVGRPDLLEKAAGVVGTMEVGARQLYRSLQKFKALPPHLQLWPGHGSGSACGKGIGSVPQSTLGYEFIANWALAPMSEDQFVAAVLAGQPEPPRYFAQMKSVNKVGPRLLGGMPKPPTLAASRLAELLDAGAVVVDIRRSAEFGDGHPPGVINIPHDKSFTTWAGWLLPYDADVYLIANEPVADAIAAAARDLALIGLDRIAGGFDSSASAAWRHAGRPWLNIPRVGPLELHERRRNDAVHVIDVRNSAEFATARLADVHHHFLGRLPAELEALPRDRPLVTLCQSGARSAIAASVLQAAGITDVANLVGGLAAWEAAGLPVLRSNGATVAA